ncbi:protein SPIRAL1-like 1 [Tasmannia lanceolata]|uniref:protein SPIRAL1-like 1 n=1 Tax=Tasmannia lanceolata TaxID=3420 RepID=UPI004063E0D7
MGRGNSSGGGQSSLGYLFGGHEPAQPVAPKSKVETVPVEAKVEEGKPTGVLGRNFNNYQRADGQNTGNFITDRPTTKVHAAPGGGSSLNYLFGGGGN